MLGAWALAFGCAVGSDAFVMPWNDFLPKAGPLGTVLGIFIGGLIMTVVAWNFHYMINRQPGFGGTYAYASEAFGHDHGFLCGVFLAFAYLAIVWLDVSAVIGIGGTFNFIAGKVKRAPRWMQRCGLEWIYRISQEPGRLWRRYAYGVVKFPWLSLRALLGGYK